MRERRGNGEEKGAMVPASDEMGDESCDAIASAQMSQVWEGAKARMQQKIFVVRFSLRPGLRALLADASETNQVV